MSAAPMQYERTDGQRVESLSGHESTSGAHGHRELRLGVALWPPMINVSSSAVCLNSMNAAFMR
jgi:hypothetical protein